MAGLKAEVYFWFLLKSRGRFFRIGIGLHILWPLLSCFAPLIVPSITKVASWSKMAAKTPNITVCFTQQEGKKGGKIEPTLIMILPRCCTSDFHSYPIGLHLVTKLYLSAQGIGNRTLYFWQLCAQPKIRGSITTEEGKSRYWWIISSLCHSAQPKARHQYAAHGHIMWPGMRNMPNRYALLIHSFCKHIYLLSLFYVPSTFLATKNRAENKTDKVTAFI